MTFSSKYLLHVIHVLVFALHVIQFIFEFDFIPFFIIVTFVLATLFNALITLFRPTELFKSACTLIGFFYKFFHLMQRALELCAYTIYCTTGVGCEIRDICTDTYYHYHF